MNKKSLAIIGLALLLGYYGFFIANKIDLTTSDLGRHLKNGETVVSSVFSNPGAFNQLVKTNFYSYTYPNYSFVNHHWLSGVIFYFIEKLFGFKGLSLFYIVLSLIVFVLFFKIAQKNSNFTISFLTALLLIPLIAERKEIRPEIFSYLFIALFFWILWHYRRGAISRGWLIVLPIMGIVWANLHIYFIFGLFLIGVFLFAEVLLSNKIHDREFWKRAKNLFLTLVFTALSFLAQPHILKGALYPLNVLREYGYRLVENQSVWFLQKIGIISNPNLILFEIIFLLLILSFILLFFVNRKEFSLSFFILGTTFGILAFLALRNFTLFGLFALTILAYNLDKILKKLNLRAESVKTIALTSFLIIAIFTVANISREIFYRNKGLGLASNNDSSVEFFKKENVKGPIFNNYDIGGYLIYYLFPQEKVFTDNRPEAYPISFFQDIYIPAQENQDVWEEQDKKYNFNVIFFSHRDYTPWGQNFLINRTNDKSWAPVFIDQYAIIFLKRNDLNKNIIEKNEIINYSAGF